MYVCVCINTVKRAKKATRAVWEARQSINARRKGRNVRRKQKRCSGNGERRDATWNTVNTLFCRRALRNTRRSPHYSTFADARSHLVRLYSASANANANANSSWNTRCEHKRMEKANSNSNSNTTWSTKRNKRKRVVIPLNSNVRRFIRTQVKLVLERMNDGRCRIEGASRVMGPRHASVSIAIAQGNAQFA